MIIPASDRVNQSCRVNIADNLGELLLRVGRAAKLTPALIVDDLPKISSRSMRIVTRAERLWRIPK